MPGSEPSDDRLLADVCRLQAEWRQEILRSLTRPTTVRAIEARHPYLTDPAFFSRSAAEWEALAAAWAAFRAAAAAGGEVWEFRTEGPRSSEEGFAVVRDGQVVEVHVTSISTWI